MGKLVNALNHARVVVVHRIFEPPRLQMARGPVERVMVQMPLLERRHCDPVWTEVSHDLLNPALQRREIVHEITIW